MSKRALIFGVSGHASSRSMHQISTADKTYDSEKVRQQIRDEGEDTVTSVLNNYKNYI